MRTRVTLYAVGKIVGCFGIKGIVKVRPFAESPDRLKELRSVFIGTSDRQVLPSEVEEVVLRGTSVLIKLRTIRDRTAAESAVGQYLFVDESAHRDPPEGSYFIDDVVGSEVWSTDGEFLGTVKEVYRLPAQDVWAIERNDTVSLIPAVKEFVQKVEPSSRKIVIRVIEGLMEQ